MARHYLLSDNTAKDIDRRIKRILRGLGNPDPPLRLEDVRELLNLDRKFYTADDPSVVREYVSRVRIAGIQIYKRPKLIVDVIRKLSLQALYIPDRRRILLDESLPRLKHRWNEGHEIGHSIIPWHEDVMLGDNALTLYPYCRDQVEAEANYAAGRLLFLCERFTEEVRSGHPSIEVVRVLSGRYGNTLSSTLYRVVESGVDLPMVGIISQHPHEARKMRDHARSTVCRHFIRSPAFLEQFANTNEADLLAAITGYCGAQRGGPLGQDVLTLNDDSGARHEFFFETFYNRYDALTLGRYLRPTRTAIPASA